MRVELGNQEREGLLQDTLHHRQGGLSERLGEVYQRSILCHIFQSWACSGSLIH